MKNSISELSKSNLKLSRHHQILCKKRIKHFLTNKTLVKKKLKVSALIMEKTLKELLKEFVNSQQFASTTNIMNSMKELFSNVLQTVIEAELEEKLGYEKIKRVSDNAEKGM